MTYMYITTTHQNKRRDRYVCRGAPYYTSLKVIVT